MSKEELLAILREIDDEDVIKAVAALNAKYYNALQKAGIPPEQAATITAHTGVSLVIKPE